MYKPESFSGSKEVDVEKSTEIPRSQIFGNKALKAAELYKRREELLKKKAELEKKLRAAGINPDEIANQTRTDFYAKRKSSVDHRSHVERSNPAKPEPDSQKINVRLITKEALPKVVAKKAQKNRGIKRLLTGVVLAGLTTIITATSLGGSALKKNQKNIPKTSPIAVEEAQDPAKSTIYEAMTDFNMASGLPDTTETKVIERADDEKPSAEPVNIDSVITNPAETSVDAQIVDAQPVDVQLLDTQVVDTVVPQESQISSEQSVEQDSEEEAEEHHHHHHKKNKDKDNFEFEDEDDEDQEDENEEENESNENANPGLIDPGSTMAPPPMVEEPMPVTPESDDVNVVDDDENNEESDWDDDWGDDLNDESEEENEEGAEDGGDAEDGLDYEMIEEPEMLEPLAPPEPESIPEEPAPEPLVIEPIIEEPEALSEPEPEPEPAPSSWGGAVLNSSNGRINGPSGEETYYNLKMNRVVENMHNMGFEGDYWVRDDGVKMFGNYVMVAADLNVHPRGSLVETSLGTGIVCDTGDFAKTNPTQLDIATTW